jgi:predicted nucleic acid-binding protein
MTGSPIVIDASIALRWLLPDALSAACWKLFEQIVASQKQMTAPMLWQYEITSGLAKAVRFKSIRPEDANQLLDRSAALGIALIPADAEQSQRALVWSLRLQRASAYDSYYLALAESLKCDLWTADRRLFNCAKEDRLVEAHWLHWIEEVQL